MGQDILPGERAQSDQKLNWEHLNDGAVEKSQCQTDNCAECLESKRFL